MRYLGWLLQELGRVGLSVESLAPVHEQPLDEVLTWLEQWPNHAHADLIDPLNLDFDVLAERWRHDRNAKPRIEVWAELTKKRNLSVRWYPTGFHDVDMAWGDHDAWNSGNMMRQRVWPKPPDFRWFRGDEAATWSSRATNELMFLRGVENLRIRDWSVSRYNHDVVSGLIIAGVASAYNAMINSLEHSFEVTRRTAFELDVEELPPDEESFTGANRVVDWRLVDLPPAPGWTRNELKGRPPGEVLAFQRPAADE